MRYEKDVKKKTPRVGDAGAAGAARAARPVPGLAPGVLALVAAMAVAACDLDVQNPGPVQDDFLDDPGAHEAVVTGIELNHVEALNMVGFFGSSAAKEYTQAGRIHPIKLPTEPRQLDVDVLPDNAWNNANQARWVAEAGVERLREEDGEDALVAEALLYAGYTNRMLGENMCEAVIDQGEPQPHTEHLERAEGFFTDAMSVAEAAGRTDVATAAQAGRASVRLYMGDDAGASSDAAAVPEGFQFQAQFSTAQESQYNFIQFISANEPYRAHSVYDTYYEDYYEETGDPRVRWGTDPDVPTGEFEWVPWLFQLKYEERDSPMNLSTGREMVLVEAEVLLREGNWQAAVDLLNGLRDGLESDHDQEPIPEWEAENEEEAWTALKRERGIELWLETRRLGDLRRWVENDVPGEKEDVSDLIRLCFPISDSERQTNPNIALDHQDPVNPRFEGS